MAEVWTGESQWAVLFPWVVILIGVVVFFLLTHLEIPVPYAACIFGIGAIMGVAAYATENDDQLTQSILQWSEIDSQSLLLVFLPGLIFRDAISINMPLFTASFSQIFLLAFPVVIMGTFLTAVAAVYLLGMDWTMALTLGSILASTDPVAVSSVLSKAGAPPRLQMHLGGESLLNDGSAVVLYTIFSQQFFLELGLDDVGRDIDFSKGVAVFFRMALGGPAVGMAFALLLMGLLHILDRRLEKENNVLQVAAAVAIAYLSYYVSEQVCQMSGVLACVTTGIVTTAFGKGLVRDPELMDSYLILVEHLLNTLLFALGGVVWGEVLVTSDYRVNFSATDWGYLILLYVMVMVIRMIQIGTVFPVMSRIGLKTSWQESTFLAFGGLRGSVGVALALALDRAVRESTEDEYIRAITSRLIGYSGGVTFMTLVVNGSLASYVLRWLGLAKHAVSNFRMNRLFEENAHDFAMKELKRLLKEPRFVQTDLHVIDDHVPFLKGLSRRVKRNKSFLSDYSSGGYLAPDEYLPDDDIYDEEEDHPLDRFVRCKSARSDVTTEDLVVDVREIFCELLQPTYAELITRGELDDGADILRQTVAFGVENVKHHEALHDWDYADNDEPAPGCTNMFASMTSFRRFFFSCSSGPADQDQCRRQRLKVLRAIAFVEAHRRVETRLRSYLDNEHSSALTTEARNDNDGDDDGDDDDDDDDFIGSTREPPSTAELARARLAIEMVLQESREEVARAEQYLMSVDEDTLSHIISHYVCTILLHRLQGFVERNAKDGALSEKNARLYLEKVDRQLRLVQNCSKDHQGPSSNAVVVARQQTSSRVSDGTQDSSSD